MSTQGDSARLFGDVRAVVVDEVHAFAGDDRGWHLLAVLERLGALARRPVQRIGLSATVGNPEGLLQWLQGSFPDRARTVVAPETAQTGDPDLALDYVGNLRNAATVVAGIHHGEKRLVFADSRRTVEAVAVDLRERGVDTYVSHSSLAAEERRRAEAAFADARDCVIVATSTLELGIDVGDLDRVVQIGAPHAVSSVLQRLGRTGRRPGTTRNLTVLATDDEELLRGAALLLLLGEGFVEPLTPPPQPRHVAAQQFLGVTLQKGAVVLAEEAAWMARLGLASSGELETICQWLVTSGHLDVDQGLAFVGPSAAARFGRRNFLELLSVFTAVPEVTVVHGRDEIGTVDPMLLVSKATRPRIIALAGRPWEVTHVDWRRRRAYVRASDRPGTSRWSGDPRPYSYELADSIRRVLLGATPKLAALTRRADYRMHALRSQYEHRVTDDSTVVAHDDGRVQWWTFAGARANALLTAALAKVAPELLNQGTFGNLNIELQPDARASAVATALRRARSGLGGDLSGATPPVSESALKHLKFAELLPPALAASTLARRNADHLNAAHIARGPVQGFS